MTPIPAPHFSGDTLSERIVQVERTLIRLIDELNMILPMLEKGEQK